MKHYTILLLLLGLILTPFTVSAQSDSLGQNLEAVPVIYKSDTLFYLYGSMGPYSAAQRAEGITNRLEELIADIRSLSDSFSVRESEFTHDIFYGDHPLMSLTNDDALGAGYSRNALAEDYVAVLENALNKGIEFNSVESILKNLGLLLLSFLLLALMFWGVRKLFDYIRGNIKKLERNIFFRNNRFIRFFEYITPRRERDLLLVLSRTLRYTLYFFVLFFYLPFVLSALPWTRPYAQKLWGFISKPLETLWDGFASYLPNLFFILAILIITRYFLRFLRYLATEVERGKVKISGFYGDWAMPTYKLARVLILAFALIVMFPYLPGSDSPAFQGVSIFLGLLLSLGSSTAVANIVAGLLLRI